MQAEWTLPSSRLSQGFAWALKLVEQQGTAQHYLQEIPRQLTPGNGNRSRPPSVTTSPTTVSPTHPRRSVPPTFAGASKRPMMPPKSKSMFDESVFTLHKKRHTSPFRLDLPSSSTVTQCNSDASSESSDPPRASFTSVRQRTSSHEDSQLRDGRMSPSTLEPSAMSSGLRRSGSIRSKQTSTVTLSSPPRFVLS